MFGLTPEQLTTIAGAAGIISAVIALVGLPALVLGWHNHLVKRLDDNAVIREHLATALSAPTLRELYATSLE